MLAVLAALTLLNYIILENTLHPASAASGTQHRDAAPRGRLMRCVPAGLDPELAARGAQ